MSSIPGLGRFPGDGLGNSLQCSCLENPVDREAWWAIVHGVAKSWTRLKRLSTLKTIRRAPHPLSHLIWSVKVLVSQSCPTLCEPMEVAHQAPLSMEFSRQEYCSGLPSPSPGNLPNPGIEPRSPALPADSLPLSHRETHN